MATGVNPDSVAVPGVAVGPLPGTRIDADASELLKATTHRTIAVSGIQRDTVLIRANIFYLREKNHPRECANPQCPTRRRRASKPSESVITASVPGSGTITTDPYGTEV